MGRTKDILRLRFDSGLGLRQIARSFRSAWDSGRQTACGDGLSSLLGHYQIADAYTPARMESAAQLALATGACRYRSIKSILKNALDLAPCHSLVALPDGGQMQIFETLRKICFDVGGLSHCNVPGWVMAPFERMMRGKPA